MEATELVDRYVHEVGQSLPRKKRADIELELRSLLMDDLEERAGGDEPAVKIAAQMLVEYGPPEAMAARYKPERYLIGPQLFPFYRMVILIVLAAVAFGLLVSFVISFITTGAEDIESAVWSYLSAIWQGGLAAFAFTTIIFAIIERAAGDKFNPGDQSDWNPYELDPIEENDRSRIKKPELIAGIFFHLFLIILFNFYPYWIGIVDTLVDGSIFLPIIAPSFSVYIPFLTAYWSLTILLYIILLWQGSWKRSSRWMELGLNVIGLIVTFAIATGGPITTISWVDTIVRIALWIGIVVGAVQAVVKLIRLLQGEPKNPPENITGLKTSY